MKTMIKPVASAALAAVFSLGGTSCTSFDTHAKNDAATGALLGAGAGALLGGPGDRAGGALLGGALGGAAGYAIGSSRDRDHYYRGHHRGRRY